MLTVFREKFGKIAVFGIVGLLSLVFVFYGVITPKNMRGSAMAGEVNGDPIPMSEFNRAYNKQLQFFKNLLGGAHLSDEQLKNFHIRESVFRQLVQRRIMIQEAQRLGYVPADDEVRDEIAAIQAFQVNGHFDLERYKEVLEANGYTPASFEKSVRDDLSAQKWQDFFRNRVNVSDAEVRQEYLATADKRDIKYVLLTTEAGKHDVKVDPAEIKKDLADAATLNLIKNQYEMKKTTEFKGKTFDAVKEQIAHDVIASTKLDQIRKINDQIASRVLAVMTGQKSSDAKVDKILKPYGVSVKSTGFISRDTQFIPGIGQAKDLLNDAFATKSPIDPTEGGKVKKYSTMNWVLLAVVTDKQTPDLSKLAANRDTIAKKIVAQKERALFESWLEQATKKATIRTNPAALGEDQS